MSVAPKVFTDTKPILSQLAISFVWLFWGKGILILPFLSPAALSKPAVSRQQLELASLFLPEKSHIVHEVTQSKSENDTINWTVWAFVQPSMSRTLYFW